jgi:LCP family protein required for cell wall assembly
MKTTLKRGMGRGAALNGGGRPVFPPGVRTPMRRYRQPDPPRRGAWHVIRLMFAWAVIAALIIVGGAAGGLYLKGEEIKNAIAPKSKTDRAAARNTDPVIPGHPAVALVIGTDKRRGPEADLTGRSDTLMLVRADPKTDTISMLSFPRDLVVPIHCPGRYVHDDRINAAFATCGSLGSLETVKALTGLHINYFVTVNFHGFLQLVDKLGGVWLDVDHRYFNNHTGPGGYSAINLWPGYQRVDGTEALAYVRYRHFDSDLYRVQRQQFFVKALKQQVEKQLSVSTLLDVVDAMEKNIVVGGGGADTPVGLKTIYGYLTFARNLAAGHIFQSHIEGLSGYSELTTAPSNITAAVSDFLHPDVSAPEKARDVTLRIKRRSHALKPSSVTVSVLNGNGVPGSAGNAAYEFNLRGYHIVLPPTQKPQNAPNYDYANTTVYYDASQRGAKVAASQLATLFPSAVVKMTDIQIAALANGAMTTVVVGKDFTGQIAPPPTANLPKPQPAAVTVNPGATLPYLRRARHRVGFRLEVPHLLASGSEPEPLAPSRVYHIAKGHVAVRLTFEQTPTDYWGIEETDWTDAPILGSPSFEHRLGGRTYDFYYSGTHLHMIVLKENGATYWVVNTLLDALSNETMLAMAKGLRPLGGR